MNILVFTAIYPAPAEFHIPNDTKVVHYYAKQWKEAGHVVQVVYLHLNPVKKISIANIKKCGGFEADYVYDGIDVHLMEYQLLVPRANELSSLQANSAEKRIVKFLEKSFSPDKMFVHFPCSFKGIKSISDFACPTMAVLHNIDLKMLQKDPKLSIEIKNYKNTGGRNKNICRAASELLSRESDLVLSGIDESLIPSYDVIEKKLSRISNVVKIVYAGNLIKLKHVDVIIKALERVGFDYQFDIIGDGPEKETLVSLAKDNPRIHFRGRLSREDTIGLMREADVFAMVSSPETFGLVYLEAMAQGCLTIGSKNEGIDGVIVDGENGFLIPPGQVDALVECFEKIVSMDLVQKQNMISSAYDCASNMTDSSMANKYFLLNE